MNGEWVGESAQATDATPSISQPTVTAYRLDAYCQASYEVTQSTNFASQLGMLFNDAVRRAEATAFSTGSGVLQPTGIVTTLSGVTASRVSSITNGQFSAQDIFALGQNLPARYQKNASFLSNYTWEYQIRNFAGSATPLSSTFWTDLGGAAPPLLVGKPYQRTSGMMAAPLSTATASSDNVMCIADFSNYLVLDTFGTEIHFSDWVVGSEHRPTGENGWLLVARIGGGLLNNDSARLLVC